MTGILLIDKPPGPTSHDVVARIRRTSGEKRVGHTGTLDPRATGLLPLVMGQATRLASLLTGGEKRYEAVVRLGTATDTDDADGEPIGEPASGPLPDREAIELALEAFRGTFAQLPPSHSAKKVGGRKAYDLARRDKPVNLTPVDVTVRELALTRLDGDAVGLDMTATAGFYVRALARDLGRALGCGAHLASLRRTVSGGFRVEDALPLEEAERLGPDVAGRLIGPAAALPGLPAVTVNEAGERRILHGNPVGPESLASGRSREDGPPGWLPPASAGRIRGREMINGRGKKKKQSSDTQICFQFSDFFSNF